MSTAAGRKFLDVNFIEELAARKINLEKTFWKVAIFNLAIIVVLFLNSSIMKVEFAVSGVTARDIGKIKEILLIISATLSVIANIAQAEINALDGILKSWLRQSCPESIREFMSLRFGNFIGVIPSITQPNIPHHYETLATKIWYLIFFISLMLFVFSIVGASILVYVIVIIDIIKSPSLPWVWSWLVVGYVIIVNLIAVGLIGFRWMPLPYRDYSFVMELTELRKADSVGYEKKIREFIAQDK